MRSSCGRVQIGDNVSLQQLLLTVRNHFSEVLPQNLELEIVEIRGEPTITLLEVEGDDAEKLRKKALRIRVTAEAYDAKKPISFELRSSNSITPQEVYAAALRVRERGKKVTQRRVSEELHANSGLLGKFAIFRHPLRLAFDAAKQRKPFPSELE